MKFHRAGVWRCVGAATMMVLLAALPAGCGLFRKNPAAQDNQMMKEMLAGSRALGTIDLVNTGSGFVLVRTPYPTLVRDGTVLVVRSSLNEVARLKATPERQRGKVAADITQGRPRLGDQVYFVAQEKPAEGGPEAVGTMTAGSLPPLNQPAEPPPQWPADAPTAPEETPAPPQEIPQ